MGITPQSELTDSIKRFALETGFNLVGIAPARLENRHREAYRRWLTDGFHGDMAYMTREPERRMDPSLSLDGARSVVALALNYYVGPDDRPAEPAGKVSMYARGRDYHTIIGKKLKRLARFIRENGGSAKTYVDTGPILERAFAQAAGLGFIGKSANLITKRFGTWVFLASVITDLELDYDAPSTASCGTCRLCIDACPTQAIVDSGRVDARKCISYLTIESREPIPADLAPKIGQWAFGCDICQEVCPYNVKAKETTEPGFLQALAGSWLPLQTVTPPPGSPLKRAKEAGLRRNLENVANNLAGRSGDRMPE